MRLLHNSKKSHSNKPGTIVTGRIITSYCHKEIVDSIYANLGRPKKAPSFYSYLEEQGDIEGAKECLEENVALAESYQGGQWLKNALQDLQLLCLNHRSLVSHCPRHLIRLGELSNSYKHLATTI